MQHLKSGSRHDGADAADSSASDPLIHQPPPWLGKLLLVSLLVMLNTHVFITATTGVDQYSIFTIDLLAWRPYPIAIALACSLAFCLNVLLAFVAHAIYRFIWRRETALIKAKWSPFRQNTVAVAIPVFLAMAPSVLFGYTTVKPYYIIVGMLITVALCMIGALRNPGVKLDPGLATLWYATAVGGILVLMALALSVLLYFHSIEPVPPSNNLIWRWDHEWGGDDDFSIHNPQHRSWPEDFPQRQRDGVLIFGLTSIAYMVTVLGGAMLFSISYSTRRATPLTSTPDEDPAHTPDKHPAQDGGQTPGMVTVLGGTMLVSISDSTQRTTLLTSTPDEDPAHTPDKHPAHTPDEDPAQWGAKILKRLRNEVSEGDEEAYVAVLGGVREYITTSQYRHLVNEKSGLLRDAGLVVDRASGKARIQTKDGWERMDFRVGESYTRGSGPFELLCIYASHPGHRFKHRELEGLLKQVLSNRREIAVRDVIGQLRDRKPELPVKLDQAESFMPNSVRVCFLDRRQPHDL